MGHHWLCDDSVRSVVDLVVMMYGRYGVNWVRWLLQTFELRE